MIQKMPLISLPLPDGGQVVCKVEAVIGATTNTCNDDLTDVYIDVLCPQGITVDVDIDSFTTSWLAALLTTIDDWRLQNAMH